MTGRYPFRYGLQTVVILSGQTHGLDKEEWLMPQALKEAGYQTAIIGKWHLGHGDRSMWPRQRGFDHQYGPLIGEIDYFTHEQHKVLDWYLNGKPLKEKGYSTTLLGNAAVRLIDAHDPAKPLFLYLAFNAPHTPYQAPEADLNRYRHIADPARRAYAASISAMDDQIGRVVAALDRRGMRDNTLIVFQSDNGGVRNAMFAGEGVHVDPAAKEHLWSALTSLASAPPPERTLTGLAVLLQSQELKQALSPYLVGGPWGRLLDAEQERLGEAPVQAFETEGLIGASSAAAVLDLGNHPLSDPGGAGVFPTGVA